MSKKRLNPSRRLKAKQASVFRDVVSQYGPTHDDSKLLQQGAVRSGLSPRITLTSYAEPRSNWEGQGKSRKGSPSRFTVAAVSTGNNLQTKAEKLSLKDVLPEVTPAPMVQVTQQSRALTKANTLSRVLRERRGGGE